MSLLLIPILIALWRNAFDSPPPPQALPALPTVGIEAFETLTLEDPSYKVAEVTNNTPLLVRITGIESVGDGAFQYRLSYKGLEKGVFNLTDFIVKPTGERLKEPIATVTIESAIPAHSTYAAAWSGPPFQGRAFPYRLSLILCSIAWTGAGAFMFWQQWRQQQAVLSAQTPPSPEAASTDDVLNTQTLADLLRPLVEKAADKSINAAEKAELEGILFQYWGKDLELDHLNSVEQLRRILEHPDAGALLRTIEQWLYQPDSLITQDEINEALESYLGIPSPPPASSKQSPVELSHSNVSTIIPT